MSLTKPSTRRRIVRQDLTTVRSMLQNVKQSDRLAPLNLLGRRAPERMLDYLQKRAIDRSPIHLPIFVAPASFDGTYAEMSDGHDDAILGITKDVSLRGVGFTHDIPLEADWAEVSFDLLDAFVTLLLEVRWRNIETDRHSLMSGGRFIGVFADYE